MSEASIEIPRGNYTLFDRKKNEPARRGFRANWSKIWSAFFLIDLERYAGEEGGEEDSRRSVHVKRKRKSVARMASVWQEKGREAAGRSRRSLARFLLFDHAKKSFDAISCFAMHDRAFFPPLPGIVLS